jgi:hypothetical protein
MVFVCVSTPAALKNNTRGLSNEIITIITIIIIIRIYSRYTTHSQQLGPSPELELVVIIIIR